MEKERQIAYDWARFRHYAPNLSRYINPLVEIIDEQKSEILSLKAENERLKAEQQSVDVLITNLYEYAGVANNTYWIRDDIDQWRSQYRKPERREG